MKLDTLAAVNTAVKELENNGWRVENLSVGLDHSDSMRVKDRVEKEETAVSVTIEAEYDLRDRDETGTR